MLSFPYKYFRLFYIFFIYTTFLHGIVLICCFHYIHDISICKDVTYHKYSFQNLSNFHKKKALHCGGILPKRLSHITEVLLINFMRQKRAVTQNCPHDFLFTFHRISV